MPRGKSNYTKNLDPLLRHLGHQLAMYYFVVGAKWMLEDRLGLPHLSIDEVDDEELKELVGKFISTKDILDGFTDVEEWNEEEYSSKAIRQIFDKVRNDILKRKSNDKSQ